MFKLLLVIENYYQEENNQSFNSIQDFKAYFFSKNPALKKADNEYYRICFDELEKLDISQTILEEVLEGHRKRAIASEVADLAWGIAQGKREFLELPDALQMVLADNYVVKEAPLEFVTDDLEELFNTTYGKPGLKWGLKTLRAMMGSLRKGDFGFLFARPEAGKTTFLADQVGYMSNQCKRPILHFNNEEFGNKVKLRYYQATLGLTTKELFQDFKKNRELYNEYTRGNIKLVDRASFSKADCEDIIARVNPELIVFDSIDKLTGFKESKEDTVDTKYKVIYQWARELAKVYGPVIGVCHASTSGEGKKYLEMDDVAYAKTAKQGEADWILGIGKTHDPMDEKRRFLHLCKNKLLGDEQMREDLRHGRLPVKLYADIAQYDDEIDLDD